MNTFTAQKDIETATVTDAQIALDIEKELNEYDPEDNWETTSVASSIEDVLDDVEDVKEAPVVQTREQMEEGGFELVKGKRRHRRSDATQLSDEEVEALTEVKEEVDTNPRNLDEDEFPALGTVPTPTKKQSVPRALKPKKGDKRKKVTRFIVATSRIEEIQRERREHVQNERDAAFAKLENKEELSTSLEGTKVCKYVVRDPESGEFGTCYREKCTFAHSKESLKDPLCAFGDKCRHIHGRRDRKTGQLNTARKCMFRHPSESREEYMERTGKDVPDLPDTDEKTRQPKPRKQRKQRKPRKPKQRVLGDGVEQFSDPRRPKMKINLSPTPPTTPTEVIQTIEAPWAPKKLLQRRECIGGVQALKVRWPSNYKKVPDNDLESVAEETVIRVPAAMFEKTMEMCIARGMSNFRIEITE
jgi:hypothetical protein